LHADLNAAFNILHRAKETLLSEPKGLGSGALSAAPEAQPVAGFGQAVGFSRR